MKKNFRSEQFSTSVNFCFFDDRDVLRNKCNNGWKFNFILNGGSNITRDTIQLYSYINNRFNQISTNLFLRKVKQAHLIKSQEFIYYLPGNCHLLKKSLNVLYEVDVGFNQTCLDFHNRAVLCIAFYVLEFQDFADELKKFVYL